MRCRAILFAAILLLLPSGVSAGIINVQSILATEAEEGISGNLAGAVDWRTGNINFLAMSATPVARYRADKHLLIGIVRLERKTATESVIVSRTFEHLRYRYLLTDRFLFESFAQHTYDGVRRLNLRAIAGIGGKVDVAKGEKYGVGLGLAYMAEYERIKDDMELDGGDTDFANRASSYLTAHYELDDRVQLLETFYVQPRLTDFRDTRLLNESSITFKVTERLSWSTALTIAFDSRVPLTIEELDTALQSAVSFEL